MHDHEEKAKFVSTSITLTRIRLFINRGGGSDGDWIFDAWAKTGMFSILNKVPEQ